MNIINRLRIFLITLLASTAVSFGASYTWNGGSGDWSVAGNWTPSSGPPGLGDTATVNSGAVTVSADTTVGTFSLGGGTVNGSGTLTVNGVMTWTAGTMGGVGRTVIAEGATLVLNNPSTILLSVRVLENAGTITWIGSGTFNTETGAVITNRVGALFDAQSDAVLQYTGGPLTRLDNAGIFRKSPGSGTVLLSLPFNNYGTNEVQTGTLLCNYPFNNYSRVDVAAGATLRLAGGGSASGTFAVVSGGLVDVSGGNYNLESGAQFLGAGLHRISGGILSVNGSAVAENLALSGGTLNGSGTLTISNVMTWMAGVMSGAGRTVIAEGATLNVNNPSTVTLSARVLENAGTVNWNGSGYLDTDTGAVITNRAGALFEAQSDTSLRYTGGSATRFDNVGTFRKTAGAGTTTLSLTFNNYGTVELPIGFMAFNSGYFSTSTSIIAVPISGTTVGTGFGRMQISGGVTLAGTLTTTLENGFYPGTNALFTFLTAGTRSGTLSELNYPSNDVGMKITYTSTSAIIEVINVRPVLDPIAGQISDELVSFGYNATAHDDDRPAQTLTFSLINSPAGATIVPTTGQITWMPSEAQGPMTTNITVRVTDNGTPNLTVSRTFQLVINEINLPPLLTPQPDTNVNEGVHFTATATATDPDIPANSLTFALVSGPAGLTVSTNGVIDWTPDETQGPSSNTVFISVTDTNALAVNEKSLSVTNSFQIVVNEVNLPPALTVPANQVINEQTPLAVSASATDPDLPPNPLTFTLVSPPDGMVIDPGSGLISWTPAEDQGPSTNTITVVVTDDSPFAVNARQLSVTNTFVVAVMESNSPPVLALPADMNINELVHFTALATATDPDIPVNPLTFALVSGPAGLTVSTSGEINWTPDESQGPSTNTVFISVTDSNSVAVNANSLSVTSSFQIVVSEVNVAPVLGPLSDYVVNAGQTVSFTATATDTDLPANSLTFSLLSAPADATITSGGVFNWRLGVALRDTTNTIQLRVQDNGAPVLNDTRWFSVIVNPLSAPVVLTPLGYANGQFTLEVSGPPGPDYVIMTSTNLAEWSDQATNPSPVLPFQHTDPQAGSFSNRAYRVRLQP